MDVYAIIGRSGMRKSSIIRSLTGSYNRNIRDILLVSGSSIRVYTHELALQSTHVSENDIRREMKLMNSRINAVLLSLWSVANPANRVKYPDGLTYLTDMEIEGWNIKKVLVLERAYAETYSQYDMMYLPDVLNSPINQIVSQVREYFEWV